MYTFYLVLIITIISFCVWQNNDIIITNFDYINSNIPKEFNNYKIIHISDLHNKEFGFKQKRLIKHVKDIAPDVIVITGDLIDSYHPIVENSLDFIIEAIKIAPIFYVSGNHESRYKDFSQFKNKLLSLGVKVLDNESVLIHKNKYIINLVGLSDFNFINSLHNVLEDNLNRLINKNYFNILLSHRPELFKYYEKSGYDLVFCGHAHGGQIRLPIIGGLIAPNQGFFPKYTKGIYTENSTSMVVSRGLGNSLAPIRIFNRPELVVINLKR